MIWKKKKLSFNILFFPFDDDFFFVCSADTFGKKKV